MKKISILLISIFFISSFSYSQSDFSSPYSLYGIGEENSSFFGGFSGMGNTGIAFKDPFTINKSNPASLTSIAPNTFLYELGLNTTYSKKTTNSTSQNNFDYNMAHLAMAFQIKDYWKMNVGLVPYTKVSYEVDVNQVVEGTTLYLNTNVTGSGGINEVFWGNGVRLSKNLSLGLELSALFGNISQEKYIVYGLQSATINETSNYFGLALNAGMQYTSKLFGKETTIGATINLPTSLSGSKDTDAYKSFTGAEEITFESETDESINDFNLPLKVGVGITSIINKSLTLNLDYKKNYWTDSYDSDDTFTYKDQNIFGLGAQYQPSKNQTRFWNRVKYRAGLNYNSGYLNLSDQNIDTYSFSLGLGIPVAKSNISSMINVNYSYGKEGTMSNQLIQDNYHKLSINLSLIGNWFQKQKIF